MTFMRIFEKGLSQSDFFDILSSLLFVGALPILLAMTQ